MDMKRILQAFDGASTKPVEGANDMKKFLQVVTEGANPHKVSLPVQMAMQHYQQPAELKPSVEPKDSLLKKFYKEVETEVAEAQLQKRNLINQYAHIIAERVRLKENFNPNVSPNPGFKPGPNSVGTMHDPGEGQLQLPEQQGGNHAATLEHLEKLHVHVKQQVNDLYRSAEEINGDLYALQRVVHESGLGNDVYDVMDSINESIEALRTLESHILNINESFKYHLRDVQNRIDDEQDDGINEANELKIPQKPRQGPLRTQTGGGMHRDKKKEQKQGKEKHKSSFPRD